MVDNLLSLEIWGDFGCFTRSEFKVERVSYDLITPSAARGVFEAIHWKPEIHYQIESIELLKPIRWQTLRRNELSSFPQDSFSIEEQRTQRSSLLLKDVHYRLQARLETEDENPAMLNKHLEIFNRRLEKGQCSYQPHLGCREFVAWFAPVSQRKALDYSSDLGFMFYDHDYEQKKPQAIFFRAELRNGRLQVPAKHSPELRR